MKDTLNRTPRTLRPNPQMMLPNGLANAQTSGQRTATKYCGGETYQ